MKDRVSRVDYFAVTVQDAPGEGAAITSELSKRGINLIALHGFPIGENKAQIDFVPEDAEAFRRAMEEMGRELGPKKTAFLIEGEDRVGAVAEINERLARAGLNIVAETGLCAGSGRYACLLWVSQEKIEDAARALETKAEVR